MKIKIGQLRNLIRETLQERFGDALLEDDEARERKGPLITEPEIDEVTPKGGESMVRALKKRNAALPKGSKKRVNPWAVTWAKKKKGQLEGDTGNTNIGLEEMPMDESDSLESTEDQGKKMPGPKVK